MSNNLPFTADDIIAVVGVRKGRARQQREIVEAIIKWLPVYGPAIGIMMLHRLRDFFAQIGHESADFAYTKEIGGSKRRYAPWYGRGLIQLTWLTNYQAFVRWLWAVIDKITGKKSPDYSTARYRDMVAEMPVAFLTAIFYWQWRKLNRYADNGDYRKQTKVINGGYNGWPDRVKLQGRFGLMLLGYEIRTGAYRKFQADHGLKQTDKYDEATERKMTELLKAAPALDAKPTKPTKRKELPMGIGSILTLAKTALGLFSGQKSAGALGAIITALGLNATGAIDTSNLPVGLDILKGDWGAIASAGIGGLITVAQNMKNWGKANAEAQPAPPEDEQVVGTIWDIDGDGVIDQRDVRAAIHRAMTGKTADEDPTAYADVIAGVMGGDMEKNYHTGIISGLDLGCLLRDRFHASQKLKAKSAAEAKKAA